MNNHIPFSKKFYYLVSFLVIFIVVIIVFINQQKITTANKNSIKSNKSINYKKLDTTKLKKAYDEVDVSAFKDRKFINQPDSLFWDFLQEYSDDRVYIEFSLKTYDWQKFDTLPEKEGFYKVGAKNVNYTFSDGKPKGTYKKGLIKYASMDLLWPLGGGGILTDADFYDDYNTETLQIVIKNNSKSTANYDKGFIKIKGYFEINNINNHGNNLIMLKSK